MSHSYNGLFDPEDSGPLTDAEEEARHMKGEQQAINSYQRKLATHPDCRDPDHPGCALCMPEWSESEGYDDDNS